MDDFAQFKPSGGSADEVGGLPRYVTEQTPPKIATGQAELIPTPEPRGLTADLEGDSYDQFLAHLLKERRTGSALEGGLISDFARCQWRLTQLEHWEEQIIRSLAPRKLATLLEDFVDDEGERTKLVKGWSLAETNAVARVRELFTAAGLATTVIEARIYFDRIDDFMKVAKLIGQARKAKTEAFRALNTYHERIDRAAQMSWREARDNFRIGEERSQREKEDLMRGSRDLRSS